ncbi:NAD(P)/FAD-dependent oxidoreductase [Desulfosporosinus sp.]|uniref:NAD(P)/FAD-dependent oxidoreductase n=1 Tax=Desulfosporosinus sp. TaxID=157907 RepID=UPI0025BAEE4D|nr:NAD(P)/FAD-dependent oxidoreductase [Desulfosporosinus sp.]MBC2722594.1 NAD(P)/FAD-dependent oxidoreductase [Desulfosporosinus sp.]MBC2729008.1 NAD(P)/FAD-dependent oxidoreductase [Desulfosporosinus sp.]
MSEDLNMLKDHYELAIIGCGPAGMSAALNAKIRNRDFVLLGSEFCSPKLSKAPQVDNWLGFPEIGGEELRQRFLDHVKQKEIPITQFKVTNIYPGPPYTLIGKDQSFEADTVIIATGVTTGKLFPGEAELLGKGVGYCATCDGPLYKNKQVAIISYNQEGEEEANYMADICSKVYYIPYYSGISKLDPRIEVKKGRVQKILGVQMVEQLDLGEEQLSVAGVFILRDTLPAEQLVSGLEMEESSIKVNHKLETNLPGLFAAGDCTGQPYQLIKAAGEGGTAALQAVKYLDNLKS